MFGEEDEIECDYDDDYLMLATPSPSILTIEERRVQESSRVRKTFVFNEYTTLYDHIPYFTRLYHILFCNLRWSISEFNRKLFALRNHEHTYNS